MEYTLTTKTFGEWSAAGYRIRRGAKAIRIQPDGKARFDHTQVYRPPSNIFNDDQEEDAEQGNFYGINP